MKGHATNLRLVCALWPCGGHVAAGSLGGPEAVETVTTLLEWGPRRAGVGALPCSPVGPISLVASLTRGESLPVPLRPHRALRQGFGTWVCVRCHLCASASSHMLVATCKTALFELPEGLGKHGTKVRNGTGDKDVRFENLPIFQVRISESTAAEGRARCRPRDDSRSSPPRSG